MMNFRIHVTQFQQLSTRSQSLFFPIPDALAPPDSFKVNPTHIISFHTKILLTVTFLITQSLNIITSNKINNLSVISSSNKFKDSLIVSRSVSLQLIFYLMHVADVSLNLLNEQMPPPSFFFPSLVVCLVKFPPLCILLIGSLYCH